MESQVISTQSLTAQGMHLRLHPGLHKMPKAMLIERRMGQRTGKWPGRPPALCPLDYRSPT